MPIRDVTSGKTGSIGPIRYVENGKTVNIPIAYVVENGKTVLVYKEEEKVYTPTGDTYYLYNRGSMSDVLGGFRAEGGGNTVYSEQSGYLSLRTPKGSDVDITITSTHIMDLTAYKSCYIEYAYVNAATGAGLSAINVAFRYYLDATPNGIYNILGRTDSPMRVATENGFWADCTLKLYPMANQPLSYDVDAEFRIYSIYVTKTY